MARLLETAAAVLLVGGVALVKLDLADDAARLVSPQPEPRNTNPWSKDYVAPPPSEAVYYRNCSEARSAGAAPIRRGEPGYRTNLDADGDGVACEPYYGR